MSTRRRTSHVFVCLLLGTVSLGAVVAALLAGDVTAAGALGAGLVTVAVTAATIYTLPPDDRDPLAPKVLGVRRAPRPGRGDRTESHRPPDSRIVRRTY